MIGKRLRFTYPFREDSASLWSQETEVGIGESGVRLEREERLLLSSGPRARPLALEQKARYTQLATVYASAGCNSQ
jgi:hypothetical protein